MFARMILNIFYFSCSDFTSLTLFAELFIDLAIKKEYFISSFYSFYWIKI